MKTKLLFYVILVCIFILLLSYVDDFTTFTQLYFYFLPLCVILMSTFLKDAFSGIKQEQSLNGKIWLALIYGTALFAMPTWFITIKMVLIDAFSLAYLEAIQVILAASLIVYAILLMLKKLKNTEVFVSKK